MEAPFIFLYSRTSVIIFFPYSLRELFVYSFCVGLSADIDKEDKI